MCIRDSYYVYVIDDDERLRGIFPLKKMITSPSVSKVKHVMQKDPISVHVDTPIDEVVQAIEKYDLVAIPVVDSICLLYTSLSIICRKFVPVPPESLPTIAAPSYKFALLS